jgi:hypothetical protein
MSMSLSPEIVSPPSTHNNCEIGLKSHRAIITLETVKGRDFELSEMTK